MSDGSEKSGNITDDLDKLKASLSKGIPFDFKMKDEEGKDVKLSFSTV